MNRRPFGTRASERVERLTECLSCGATIGGTLSMLGSLRCLDCRSLNRPLDPSLAGHAEGPALRRGPSTRRRRD